MGEKYRVVFNGELSQGSDVSAVKKRLAALFKINDPQKIEKMFSGRMVIKKGASLEVCQKVKQAFDKTGAVCSIEPEEDVELSFEEVEEESPKLQKKKVAPPKGEGKSRPYIPFAILVIIMLGVASLGNRGFTMAVATISALWVYFDATKKGIGKDPNKKSFLNISAGGWAVATILVWVIALPLYVFKNPSLKEKAKHHPVRISKGNKIAVSSLLGLFLAFFLLGGYSLHVQKAKARATIEKDNQTDIVEDANYSPPQNTDTGEKQRTLSTIQGKPELVSEANMLWYYVDGCLIGALWEIAEEEKKKLEYATENGKEVVVEGVIDEIDGDWSINKDYVFTVTVIDDSKKVTVAASGDAWAARDAYIRGYPYKIGVYFETFTDTEWMDGYDTDGNRIVIFRGKVSERIRNNFYREASKYFYSLREGTDAYKEYMALLQMGLKKNRPDDAAKIYQTVMNGDSLSFSEKIKKLVPIAYDHMFVVGTPIEIRLAPDGDEFGRRFWKVIEFFGVDGVDAQAIVDVIYSS